MNNEALYCFTLSCIFIFILYPITESLVSYRFERIKSFDKYHKRLHCKKYYKIMLSGSIGNS